MIKTRNDRTRRQTGLNFKVPHYTPAKNRIEGSTYVQLSNFRTALDQQLAAERDRERYYEGLREKLDAIIERGSVQILGEIIRRANYLASKLEKTEATKTIWMAQYLIKTYERDYRST